MRMSIGYLEPLVFAKKEVKHKSEGKLEKSEKIV